MSLLWLVKLQITRYEILLSDCHENRIYNFNIEDFKSLISQNSNI